MSDNFVTFKGYCNAENLLASGQRVGILKTTVLNISWLLPEEQTQVTHVRFRDLMVTNLQTGMPVTGKPVSSPDIPIVPLSPLNEFEGRLPGAAWLIDEDQLPASMMQEYVDYRVSGVAVELSNNEEVDSESFDIYLMRDCKSIPASLISEADNWSPGTAALLTTDGTAEVRLRDTVYDKSLNQILTIYYHGNLALENGDIVFNENKDLRKVYYLEMINEEYKWVNGRLERLWDYKKQHVDPSLYGYDRIYERLPYCQKVR